MKLALIPPISLLHWTSTDEYQLMLPQLLSSQDYVRVYKKHCEDPDTFVILDNGAAEGESVAHQELVEVAESFGVDELVIPDVMGDGVANVLYAEKFLNEYKDCRPDLMFVVQGRNWDEFKLNIFWAIEQEGIDTIGIPRHAIETLRDAQARRKMVELVAADSDMPIHLLGASRDHVCELMHWTPMEKRRVRGTDTSVPFSEAYFNDYLGNRANAHSRPDDYFNLSRDDFPSGLVAANVGMLEGWVK